MKAHLYSDVYKWMISIQVLRPDPKNHHIKNNGKVEVDDQLSLLLWNGIKVAEILSKIESVKFEGSALKDLNSPTARLYNWNILTERLKKIGVELDTDIKSLIVGGDLEMISEVLKDIYDLQKSKGLLPQRQSTPNLNKSQFGKTQQWEQQKKSLEILNNIEQMNSAKPLQQTECLLEFILISLCRGLNLKPKQASQLLNNNNKLLSHICVKGVKNQFAPLITWLQDVFTNWAKLIDLCRNEDNNIALLLNVLKPTLLSKDEEVADWGLRLLTKISYELANNDLLFHVFHWTIKDNGSFATFILTYQRQPQLAEQLSILLLQIARYDISDFFITQMKKFFDSSKTQLEFLAALLPYLTQSSKIKESFVDSNVLPVWIQQALKLTEPELQNTKDHKIIGIAFLTSAWSIYPNFLDQNAQLQNQILGNIQKAFKDTSENLKMFTIMVLFKLLDALASQRAISASSVYKKIVYILLENYSDLQLREYMLKSFKHILVKFPNIPLDTIIDPLVKLLQSNQTINVSDCDFYKSMTAHPNLKVQSAVLMLDALVRLYNSNFVFAHALFPSISQLVQKFIDRQEFQEFVLKISTVSMAIYQASVRNKRAAKGNGSAYQLDEDSVVNSQKRALIIELLKVIINLKCLPMNEMLKTLIVAQHLELKQIEKQDNKGIIVLLSLLGDPESVVEDVVSKKEQNEDDLFLDRKLNKLGGGQSKLFANQAQEQNYEKSLLQQNQSNLVEKQKQFVQNAKDQNGEVFLSPKEEEEALMQSLLGDTIGNQQTKKTTNKKILTNNNQSVKISPIQQNEWQCIYEESELAHVDVPMVELQIVNLEEEEDLERESMNMVAKIHAKTFLYLFQKYVNSEKEAAKKRLLQQSSEKLSVRISDIFRMLRDYEIQDFTSYEEIISLVQIINTRFGQPTIESVAQDPNKSYSQSLQSSQIDKSRMSAQSQSSEKSNKLRLDYNCFCKFLCQFSILVFSRPPKNLKKLPVGMILQELFKYFSVSARRKGENSLIFDDPDGVTTVADKQTIQKWNIELSQHPELIVPETTHLKKVAEPDQSFHFIMKKNVINPTILPDKWMMVFDIVNDIISAKFKTFIVEPISEVRIVQKVKPLHAKGYHKDQKIDELIVKQESFRKQLQTSKLNEKSQKKFEILNKSLELTISPEVNSMILNDSRTMAESAKVVNKYKMIKMVEESEKQLNKEVKETKFEKRKQYLDKQFEKIKDFKNTKEIDRITKTTVEVEKIIEMQKKEEESKSKLEKEKFLKEKRDEMNQKQSQLLIAKKEKEDAEKKAQKEKKDKEIIETKEFIKKETKKISEKIHQKSESVKKQNDKIKKKEEEEKKEAEKPPEVKEKDNAVKRKQVKEELGKIAEKQEQEKEKKKQISKQIKDLYNSPEIQGILKAFSESGKRAFTHYLQYSDNDSFLKQSLTIDGWVKFTKMFDIHPQIITEDQCRKIYHRLLKAKNKIFEEQAKQKGETFIPFKAITYNEFEQCLLNLSVQAEDFFNSIQGKDKPSIWVRMLEYRSQKAKMPLTEKLVQLESFENNLKNTNGQTLSTMIKYLEIPADISKFNERLKYLQSEGYKVQPPKQEIDVKKKMEEEPVALPEEKKSDAQWSEPGTHLKYEKYSPEKKAKMDKNQKQKQDQAKKEFSKIVQEKKIPILMKHSKIHSLQQQLDEVQGKNKNEKDGKDIEDEKDKEQ